MIDLHPLLARRRKVRVRVRAETSREGGKVGGSSAVARMLVNASRVLETVGGLVEPPKPKMSLARQFERLRVGGAEVIEQRRKRPSSSNGASARNASPGC